VERADYNLYVSANEPPGFSIGWASRDSPIRKGLDAWRAASGQDAHSWNESSGVPPSLLAALDAQQPNPDWNQVMAIASRYRVPGAQALSKAPQTGIPDQTSPGPKR
jgi:hypothetical protein